MFMYITYLLHVLLALLFLSENCSSCPLVYMATLLPVPLPPGTLSPVEESSSSAQVCHHSSISMLLPTTGKYPFTFFITTVVLGQNKSSSIDLQLLSHYSPTLTLLYLRYFQKLYNLLFLFLHKLLIVNG